MNASRIRLVGAVVVIAATAVLNAATVSNAQETQFFAVAPCRIIDTRNVGLRFTVPNQIRTFNIYGNLTSQGGQSNCNIPGFINGAAQVVALAINYVAVDPSSTTAGFLKTWATDQTLPSASTINFQKLTPNLNVANEVPTSVRQDSPGNDFSILAFQPVDVVADVVGYYLPSKRRTLITGSSTSPNLIGGFSANTAVAPVQGATIGGGGDGGGPNSVTSNFGTVGGGRNNNAGGDNDNIVGLWATVGGGEANGAAANHATVAGGSGNLASGDNATVGGGSANQAVGAFSTVPGGSSNVAGALNSFAAGAVAKITNSAHTGAIVFSAADGGSSNFSSAASKEFAVRAAGGIRLRTSDDASTGCTLPAGSGVFSCASDRNLKTDFLPVDSVAVAAKIASMPIETWRFKGEEGSVRHMGPMAQDFRRAFALGIDDKTIGHVDSSGVALAAIQGLYKLLQQKDAEIRELRSRLDGLQSIADRVERLERQLPVRTVSLDDVRP